VSNAAAGNQRIADQANVIAGPNIDVSAVDPHSSLRRDRARIFEVVDSQDHDIAVAGANLGSGP
jgi:hypothetical protein